MKRDGTVWAWGGNASGELGNPDFQGTSVAVPVRDPSDPTTFLHNILQVESGESMALALKNDETLVSWGSNLRGQLGDGTTTDRSTPVAVLGLSGVKAIAVGCCHALALSNGGTLLAWGENRYGQLCDPGFLDDFSCVPRPVPGMANAMAIAAGAYHDVALTPDGMVHSCGDNSKAQLGTGVAGGISREWLVSPGIADVRAVASNYWLYSTAALKIDGTAWAWAENGYGSLGVGLSADPVMTPARSSTCVIRRAY